VRNSPLPSTLGSRTVGGAVDVAGVDVRAGVACPVAGGALGAGLVVRMFAEINLLLLLSTSNRTSQEEGLAPARPIQATAGASPSS